ncbi:putative nicotinate-nucleotide adenylyltransferase [Colwellia marinimaniae]|uniref:Probable nicotinate-nucleotide adenylyltransferase n=2 Tax=Colwelliaceae TaxID=267889 RepID=A0ABQ0MY90_9GAMM|nr:putative nicotinate-nucleotide adenylyltransferase [Colwellia marinimaniae]
MTSDMSSATPAMTKGIGILGGTFDPIHLGHTQSAQAVANELGLTKILLIPAHIPPHKASADLVPSASAEQRAAMVEIACLDSRLFSCDQRELKRAGHSYTVETLKELKLQYPEQPIYFIIGMDSLMSFTSWYQYQHILTLCHLVVNTRPNYPMAQFNEATKKLLTNYQTTDIAQLSRNNCGNIFFAQANYVDISSTQIRQRLAQQQSCQQQLLPVIAEFIHKNKLYR